MGKIYKGQTALKLVATVGQDVTGATETLIKYLKPDDTAGQFTASISDAVNGVLEYNVASEEDLDQSGNWVFWGYVTFSDGKKAAGEAYKHPVYDEGE